MAGEHLSARCSKSEKERWTSLAASAGYDNLGTFVKDLLNALAHEHAEPDWESRLVFVEGTSVVGIDKLEETEDAFGVSAFHIYGPRHWWEHLRHEIDLKNDGESDKE